MKFEVQYMESNRVMLTSPGVPDFQTIVLDLNLEPHQFIFRALLHSATKSPGVTVKNVNTGQLIIGTLGELLEDTPAV